MLKYLAAILAGSCLAAPSWAEAVEWAGEGSVSAGVTSGNTDTSDVGIGLKFSRESQLWRMKGVLLADYGTKDGVRSKDRVFASGQGDRTLSEHVFVFGRVSHERDDFSGFNSRSFLGGGAGWQVFDTDAAKWSLEGGPGLKIDEVKASELTVPGSPPVPVPERTDESVSVIAASRMNFALNEQVSVGNDTSLLYADTSTQVSNQATLTAELTKGLSARFSFEVRHDTHPQSDFEKTDTATRMSLVYAFGG
ncbi:MAG TPA: DUF481 domain-containing protein [Alteraurantiacibacter sp.]